MDNFSALLAQFPTMFAPVELLAVRRQLEETARLGRPANLSIPETLQHVDVLL